MTRTTATIATSLLLVALATERHLTMKRLERHHRRRRAADAAAAFALGYNAGHGGRHA